MLLLLLLGIGAAVYVIRERAEPIEPPLEPYEPTPELPEFWPTDIQPDGEFLMRQYQEIQSLYAAGEISYEEYLVAANSLIAYGLVIE